MMFGRSDASRRLTFGRSACLAEARSSAERRRDFRTVGRGLRVLAAALFVLAAPYPLGAQDLPELTQPVNDFAHVIDAQHAESMDRMIRALQAATGDVVVVATVPTFEGYGSLEEYANKLFENHGRGVGEKGKDNGLLVTVAIKEHRAWIEVGYGLEPYITDGFAGETTRLYMIPEFRKNDYGAGLEAGVSRIIGRIAQAHGVSLDGVPAPTPRRTHGSGGMSAAGVIGLVAIFLLFSIISSISRGGRGPRRWGRGPWSGWNSGIGPFGGGWGGGFGGFGGGGGGGFGGFGGGASGGGGGGGGW